MSGKKSQSPLVRWVELANFLPVDADLPRNWQGQLTSKQTNMLRVLCKAFNQRRQMFGVSEKNRVALPVGRRMPGQLPAVGLYYHAAAIRGALERILDYREMMRKGEAVDHAGSGIGEFLLPDSQAPDYVYISPEGRITMQLDLYARFLVDIDGCDLAVLRRCPVCETPFLIKRKDQKACSPRCANTERVRRARSKQPEYESNRRFRKRGGLKAVRGRERSELRALHNALTIPKGES